MPQVMGKKSTGGKNVYSEFQSPVSMTFTIRGSSGIIIRMDNYRPITKSRDGGTPKSPPSYCELDRERVKEALGH